MSANDTIASPLFAVVVPAFDEEEHIGEAIESVLAQTEKRWELVVVDDGSSDRTLAVARAYDDPRIRVIAAEHSGLPAAGRNRGIAVTTAPFVAFLDADDMWLARKLELQLAALEEPGAPDIVHCAAEVVEEGRSIFYDLPALPSARGAAFATLTAANTLYTSSVVLRRSLLDDHGLLDVDPRLRGTEDYELWLRLAPHAVFAFVNVPLVRYRVHAGNISRRREAMAYGVLLALEKTFARNPALAGDLPTGFHRQIGILRCQHGLPGRGRRELLRAVRRRPLDLLALKWLAAGFVPHAALSALQRAEGALSRFVRRPV